VFVNVLIACLFVEMVLDVAGVWFWAGDNFGRVCMWRTGRIS